MNSAYIHIYLCNNGNKNDYQLDSERGLICRELVEAGGRNERGAK